ncbi:hypothetical protein AC249_AIPGENE26196 [Exaiptasia diaphana]|nr:hypothetical protein AC249_AIPGENE26196 [Exaiptasia diaphana]
MNNKYTVIAMVLLTLTIFVHNSQGITSVMNGKNNGKRRLIDGKELEKSYLQNEALRDICYMAEKLDCSEMLRKKSANL